jgi:hypothetical protein
VDWERGRGPSAVSTVPKSRSTLVRTVKVSRGVSIASVWRARMRSSLSERIWGFQRRILARWIRYSASRSDFRNRSISASGIVWISGVAQDAAAWAVVAAIMKRPVIARASPAPSSSVCLSSQ